MSRIRTAVAAIGVVVVAATSIMLGTTAAQAASNPGTLFYDNSGTHYTTCFSATSVRMNPGDSVTVKNSGPYNLDLKLDGVFITGVRSGESTSVRFSSLGTYELSSNYGPCAKVTVRVVLEPVEAPPAHDYLQQVGVPTSGDCADLPPDIGHWNGFPVGGWSKSWASWINNGNGGPVCTREVEERPDGTIVLIG